MSLPEPISAEAGPDSAKRQQVLDGARRVFLEHGFDGASVDAIAKAAGVSKGTIYAYFPSKEALFETMIFEDRRRQAEQMFGFAADGRAPAEVLADVGLKLLKLMVKPESVAYARMVISASGKFPEAGRAFFAAGPLFGIGKLADYFEKLGVAEAREAATEFIDLCASGCVKPLLFGFDVPCDEARLKAQAQRAARFILKAYEVRG